MKLFGKQLDQNQSIYNANMQYPQQGQYNVQPQQNIMPIYNRPQPFSVQRIPYVDTISYRPPAQAYQANYSMTRQQFPQMAPQPMSPFASTQMQQPIQRNTPTTFPPQPMYDYLPKQAPMDMGMYQPFAPVAKKKNVLGLAMPQVISLGIGFGLFLIGFISMITPPAGV